MPLLLSALLASPGIPGAADRPYPATLAEAAAQWRLALQAYVAGVVPPSTTVAAAGVALEAALLAAFQTSPVAPAMESAFTAFAAALGGGMAPTFVPTPPPAPVGFAQLFVMSPPATRAEGVARVATKIDVWMRTGIAAMALPPNTPQPWS